MGKRAETLQALSALAPLTTWRAHAEAGLPFRELRLQQPWTPGPDAGHPGPHVLSVNEYRPHRLRDIAPIAHATRLLVHQLRDTPAFCGIATAYQPIGQITYSLSIWTTEEAVREFTISPLHRKIMAEYRTKGYLRHVHWWGQFTTIGAAMAEATRRLDAGEGRRVGDARDHWARHDRARLAGLGPTNT